MAAVVEESTHDVLIKATNAAADAARTVASSPLDDAKAAAAISVTLSGYNPAKAAACSSSISADLMETAAAELCERVVVVWVDYLVNIDHSMNEAVDIVTRHTFLFGAFATTCMKAARLFARSLEVEVSPWLISTSVRTVPATWLEES